MGACSAYLSDTVKMELSLIILIHINYMDIIVRGKAYWKVA